ncbi:MAG: hypothetical protein IJV07_02455 [Alphaproteobacteria bacterium]|nr:hypothetical protein [Alphaproteobacteria bacterium]
MKKNIIYQSISVLNCMGYIFLLLFFYGIIVIAPVLNSKNALRDILYILLVLTLILPPYIALFFGATNKIKRMRLLSNGLILFFALCGGFFNNCNSQKLFCFSGIAGSIFYFFLFLIPIFIHNLLISLGKFLVLDINTKK